MDAPGIPKRTYEYIDTTPQLPKVTRPVAQTLAKHDKIYNNDKLFFLLTFIAVLFMLK